VLVGRVVGDEVDQDFQTERVGPGDDLVEILQRSVLRIDVVIVGHVIAVVLLRRGIERGDPDGVDAKALDILEPGDDSLKIADAVVV